jgi:tRNA nucleotidyltransferase (CCA-adding enzyme)
MDFEVSPPDQVLWIWRTLEDAGFETWIVGGAIRDVMLGRPVGDWDFATKARPKQIMDTFRRTVPIGVDHGTVGVLVPDGTLYEVTTFRRDVETFGRRAVVEFADSIEEDLSRRDFTLNALAWHPGRHQLLDLWDGTTDLRESILRTVGDPAERFAEDLLRVLRALRFAGQFGLTIEAGTWEALLAAVPELARLSAERIQEEMMKVLSQGESPSVALGLYAESGVFAELCPELDPGRPLAGVEADALAHTLRACDAVPRTRPLVRLSLLMALASASEGQNDIRDERRRAVESLMERLRFSNADTKRVATVAASLFPAPLSEDPAALRRWLHRVGPEHFPDIARAWLAGARAQEKSGREDAIRRVSSLRAILRERPPLTMADLALDGSDLKALGLSPGPQFGEILRFLLEEVLDRPEANNRADLEALALQGGFLIDGPPDPPS